MSLNNSSGGHAYGGWLGRIGDYANDWAWFVERDGWRTASTTIFQELASFPYRRLRFLVLARSLRLQVPEYTPSLDLVIRRFEEADLPLVHNLHRPSEATLCALRLAQSQRGFVAFHGTRLVGYAWAGDHIDPTLERIRIPLLHGDAVCFDAFTAPDLRGRGIQSALVSARLRDLLEQGHERVVAWVERRNLPSLAVWQGKFDGELIGMVDFVRIGPLRRSTPLEPLR